MNTVARISTWIAVLGIVGLALFVTLRAASANTGGVCDRTSQVGNAIAAVTGIASCSEVSTVDLLEVTSLDLSDQAISGPQADDFEGLVRLETLDLSHNSLTTLPAGVFDDLYLLRTLHLNNNQLTTVLSNTFEQLFLLEDLTLSDNPDLALPDGMFGDFSRFDGMQSNGELTADTGAYPHIDRFLTKHSITSPEEFIAALSALYKERFTVVFRSKAAAQDLCPVITRGSFPLAQMDGSPSPGTPTETHRPISGRLSNSFGRMTRTGQQGSSTSRRIAPPSRSPRRARSATAR